MLYSFDLDGTLVENHLVRVGNRLQPGARAYTEPLVVPAAREFVREHAEAGDVFAIVTNQAGVAFGHHTEEDAAVRIGRAVQQLRWFYGRPFTVHVCHHHPDSPRSGYRDPAECERRKPSGAMIEEAYLAHGVGRIGCTYVGDLDVDREAAEAAGVDFILASDAFGTPATDDRAVWR